MTYQNSHQHNKYASSPLELFQSIIYQVQPLSKQCWEDFASQLYEKKLSEESYFQRSNTTQKEMGFVVKGLLRMFYTDEDGSEWNKDFFMPNHFIIGKISPTDEHIFSVQALKDCFLLCISFESFMALSAKHIEINSLYLKFMSQHFEEKQRKEVRFLSMSAQERYLHFLKEYPSLLSEIPHYHIASYLGITPTQLSRIRKKIKGSSTYVNEIVLSDN